MMPVGVERVCEPLRAHTRVRATFKIKSEIVDDEEERVKSPDGGGGTREEENGVSNNDGRLRTIGNVV